MALSSSIGASSGQRALSGLRQQGSTALEQLEKQAELRRERMKARQPYVSEAANDPQYAPARNPAERRAQEGVERMINYEENARFARTEMNVGKVDHLVKAQDIDHAQKTFAREQKRSAAPERTSQKFQLSAKRRLRSLAVRRLMRANPKTVVYLQQQVQNHSDTLYILGLFGAIAKDLVDLGFITSIPGLGTIITFLIALMLWIDMAMAFAFESASYQSKFAKRLAVKAIRRIAIKFIVRFIVATIAEALVIGLNFLPIYTIVMWWTWSNVKKEREEIARQEAEYIQKQNEQAARLQDEIDNRERRKQEMIEEDLAQQEAAIDSQAEQQYAEAA